MPFGAVTMLREKLSYYFDSERGSFSENKFRLLASFGDIAHALLYAEFFSPELIEVEGSIILANYIQGAAEKFKTAKSERKRPLQELEESFNLIEIGYCLSPQSDSNDVTEFRLAILMAEAWRGKLALQYPDRKFKVSVYNPHETGSVVGIGFHEIR